MWYVDVEDEQRYDVCDGYGREEDGYEDKGDVIISIWQELADVEDEKDVKGRE